MSIGVKRDEVVQSMRVISDLVMPVYPDLPIPPFPTHPPAPIPGRQGAIAYQQSDDAPYYCDGTEWRPFCTGGTQGFQGAQGSAGTQGFQGAQGPLSLGTFAFQFNGSGNIAGTVASVSNNSIGLGGSQFGGDIVPSPDVTSPNSDGVCWFRASKSGILRNLFVTAILNPDDVPFPATGTATISWAVCLATSPVDPVPPNVYSFNFAPTALAATSAPFSYVAPGPHVISVSNTVANVPIVVGQLYGLRQTITGIPVGNLIAVSTGAGFEMVVTP